MNKIKYSVLTTASINGDNFPCCNNQVKVNVKVKVTLEHAAKAQRGSRGIALLFP